MRTLLPDLLVLGIAVALCVLFQRGMRHARVTHRPLPARSRSRAVLFGAGVLVFLLAFALPARTVLPEMAEHVLLAFAVPPLLLLGTPRSILLPLFAHRQTRRVVQALTRPARAAVLFLGVLFLCYLPGAFNAMMADDGLRLIAGLGILGTAVLFWWPIIEPFPSWERELADLGKLLYLFIGSTALKVLGFILALVPRPIYTLPVGQRPFWGLSVLTDQQYAGWLMVGSGTLVLLAAATVVCARLLYEPGEEPGALPPRDTGAEGQGLTADQWWLEGPMTGAE